METTQQPRRRTPTLQGVTWEQGERDRLREARREATLADLDTTLSQRVTTATRPTLPPLPPRLRSATGERLVVRGYDEATPRPAPPPRPVPVSSVQEALGPFGDRMEGMTAVMRNHSQEIAGLHAAFDGITKGMLAPLGELVERQREQQAQMLALQEHLRQLTVRMDSRSRLMAAIYRWIRSPDVMAAVALSFAAMLVVFAIVRSAHQ